MQGEIRYQRKVIKVEEMQEEPVGNVGPSSCCYSRGRLQPSLEWRTMAHALLAGGQIRLDHFHYQIPERHAWTPPQFSLSLGRTS